MKINYKSLSPQELLTNVYSDSVFRTKYMKWLRMGNYPAHKAAVNQVVVDYEYYMITYLEGSWWSRLKYADIDLVHYRRHAKTIAAFVAK